MKKVLSLVLALAMILALGVTALADDDTLTDVGGKDIDVKATVTQGSDGSNNTVHKYSINITWTTTEGSYKTSTGESGSSYTETTTPNVSVTVTNYSDVAVLAKADYTAASGITSSWAGVDTTGKTLATGVTGDPKTDGVTDYSSATGWGSTTFSGDVTYTADTVGTITLGTVKITISAA